MSRAVAAEGDSARTSGAGEQKGHPRQHPFERAFHRVQLDCTAGSFQSRMWCSK